jgi:hypothetical protein
MKIADTAVLVTRANRGLGRALVEGLPERTQCPPVEAVANDIVASVGVAETATVDALKRKWRLTCGS